MSSWHPDRHQSYPRQTRLELLNLLCSCHATGIFLPLDVTWNIMAALAKSGNQRVVSIVGSAGTGKSTLLGRLALHSDALSPEMLAKLENHEHCERPENALAFFSDIHAIERAAKSSCQWKTRSLGGRLGQMTFIDVPGKRKYSKLAGRAIHMGTAGAIFCFAADDLATAGKPKMGWESGQGSNHGLLLEGARLKKDSWIVCVTKMDSVGYEETVFKQAVGAVMKMLNLTSKTAGKVAILPVSAACDDNISSVSAAMPWWKGCSVDTSAGTKTLVTCLADALKLIEPNRALLEGDFRMTVATTFHDNIMTGLVSAGTIEEDSWVCCRDLRYRVTSIHVDGLPTHSARCGDLASLCLDVEDRTDVGSASPRFPASDSILFAAEDGEAAAVKKEFRAKGQMLSHVPNHGLRRGTELVMICRGAACTVKCELVVDKHSTLGHVVVNPMDVDRGESFTADFSIPGGGQLEAYDTTRQGACFLANNVVVAYVRVIRVA